MIPGTGGFPLPRKLRNTAVEHSDQTARLPISERRVELKTGASRRVGLSAKKRREWCQNIKCGGHYND